MTNTLIITGSSEIPAQLDCIDPRLLTLDPFDRPLYSETSSQLSLVPPSEGDATAYSQSLTSIPAALASEVYNTAISPVQLTQTAGPAQLSLTDVMSTLIEYLKSIAHYPLPHTCSEERLLRRLIMWKTPLPHAINLTVSKLYWGSTPMLLSVDDDNLKPVVIKETTLAVLIITAQEFIQDQSFLSRGGAGKRFGRYKCFTNLFLDRDFILHTLHRPMGY